MYKMQVAKYNGKVISIDRVYDNFINAENAVVNRLIYDRNVASIALWLNNTLVKVYDEYVVNNMVDADPLIM